MPTFHIDLVGDENDRDWREAHAWQRGYSDALAGKSPNLEVWPQFRQTYERGYTHGRLKRAPKEVAA